MRMSKRILSILTSAALIASTFGVTVFADEGQPQATKQAETDQVIVTFKDGVKKEMDELNVTSMKTVGTEEIAVLKVPEGEAIDTYVDELEGRNDIEHVEPDYLIDLAYTPSDPYFIPYQYHHKNIEVEKAWDKTMGSSNVIVAVLDSGFDLNHQDLKNQIVSPYSTVSTGMSVDDHGTHVAGIIAGQNDNNLFGSGVAPDTSIMPVDVFVGEQAYSSDVIEGIYYAVGAGADIINMSLGSYNYSTAYNNAVQYAYQSGVVVIAASGNDGISQSMYPASYENVISVGSTDSYDALSYFSNYGYNIDIVAPGSGIYSTLPYNNFGGMSGTSMATPVVAGVAALVLANEPDMTNDEVVNRLLSTTIDLGSYGADYYYGNGLVNAKQALQIIEMPLPVVYDVYDYSTTISGYLPYSVDAAKVIVRDQSGVIGTVENYSGWSYFDVTIPQQSPDKKLYVSVLDSKGNESEEIEITVMDGTAPSKPNVNEITDQSTIITGSAEPYSNVLVFQNNNYIYSSWVDGDGFFEIPISKFKAGTTLMFAVTDAAGNTSNATEVTVKDGSAPAKPVVNDVADISTQVTGSAEVNATVSVRSEGKLIGTAVAGADDKFSVTIPLQKAGVKLAVTASDEFGNTSSATDIIVKDETAPKAPSADKVFNHSTIVTGTGEVDSLISVKTNNIELGTARVTSEGTYAVTIAKQKAGTALAVTATDRSGNISETTKVLVIDGSGPEVSVKNKITQYSTRVIGVSEATAGVIVKTGTKTIGTATAGPKGNYEVVIAKQKVGTKLSIVATDAAGNSSNPIAVTVVDGNYPDLKITHWALEEIMYLGDDQIIGGYPNGGFQPEKNTTRAEAAKMLAIALDLPVPSVSSGYKDVPSKHWAKDYVAAVSKAGLFNGNPDGTFAPDKILKRSEMAKIISIAYNLKASDKNHFNDVKSGYWAKGFISGLYENGITTGYPDKTFRGEEPTTRAEYSVFLARALNKDFR